MSSKGKYTVDHIEALDDVAYEHLLLPVWDFLCPYEQPKPADVIFVFGGLGLEVPKQAAHLYNEGLAPIVVISGSSGPLTQGVFNQPEAQVFKQEMIKCGVPGGLILTENHATNTGQNVSLGMAALAAAGKEITNAILVAKAFIMRRCLATFAKQFPQVHLTPCPPRGSLLEFIDRPRAEFAARMLAELQRLDDYGVKGFIVQQNIPKEVRLAAERLRAALG